MSRAAVRTRSSPISFVKLARPANLGVSKIRPHDRNAMTDIATNGPIVNRTYQMSEGNANTAEDARLRCSDAVLAPTFRGADAGSPPSGRAMPVKALAMKCVSPSD